MDLTQKTLRGILAHILSVDEKYVVPKQGNWWNPQENAVKPDTWCAYIIQSNVPRTASFYVSDGKINSVATEKIATVALQFVGSQAEEIAQSVAFWHLRADVQEAFKKIRGALMYDATEAISSPFYQDGSNAVIAWNVTIKILWYQIIDTSQGKMPPVLLGGKIKKGL